MVFKPAESLPFPSSWSTNYDVRSCPAANLIHLVSWTRMIRNYFLPSLSSSTPFSCHWSPDMIIFSFDIFDYYLTLGIKSISPHPWNLDKIKWELWCCCSTDCSLFLLSVYGSGYYSAKLTSYVVSGSYREKLTTEFIPQFLLLRDVFSKKWIELHFFQSALEWCSHFHKNVELLVTVVILFLHTDHAETLS